MIPPARSVTIRDLTHRLAHYAAEAAAGHEFIVTRHGKPLARLGPVEAGTAGSGAASRARTRRVAKAMEVLAVSPYPGGKFTRDDAYDD